ncbi:MAG: division/cell wall cluster transcriptional repressor MraZ [Lachnospiraceae bacterium]|nr:division/cell wall cluster transcriptional repressor MraZ [Lachnospiraceae bacterium]
MFVGEYNHSLDAKGRLIIPSRFREALGDTFMVTKGLDGCLFIYDMSGWKVLEAKLQALPLTSAHARKFSRFMLGGAIECEVDKQGRILLPANLREFAHLTKDIALVGVGGRVEIWDKETWMANSAYDDMEEIAENMEGLGI